VVQDEELNEGPNENFQCLGATDILELEKKGRIRLWVATEKFGVNFVRSNNVRLTEFYIEYRASKHVTRILM